MVIDIFRVQDPVGIEVAAHRIEWLAPVHVIVEKDAFQRSRVASRIDEFSRVAFPIALAIFLSASFTGLS